VCTVVSVAVRTRGLAPWLGIALCGVAVVSARLPYLRVPLATDEGGFLLVGSQWHSGGSSLYGDYWVDRPPLLIGFFVLADALGGATPLRVLGCVAAVAVVLLAHLLGRAVSGSASLWPVLAAAAFVSMPLFGIRAVDGELVAIPFVMAGLVLALRAGSGTALGGGTGPRLALWCGAGVLGAAAVMVKQNFVDVFVFGLVLLLARAVLDRSRLRRQLGDLLALGVGGIGAVGLVLALAATRGTTPAGLWGALVVFRARAAHLIGTSASEATPERLGNVLMVLVLSGGVLVIAVLLVHALRRPLDPLVVATCALLGWELFAVLAGGSYWLHYLIGLIPGLVLTVSLADAAPGRLRTAARAVTSYALVATTVTSVVLLVREPPPPLPDRVSVWVAGQVRPGDTGVVLYGQPNMLWNAGLTSPYPELWSLQVRVRDPELVELTRILRGPDAPTWVMAWDNMNAWGIDSTEAHRVVNARYHLYADVCGVELFRLGDPARPPEHPPVSCPGAR